MSTRRGFFTALARLPILALALFQVLALAERDIAALALAFEKWWGPFVRKLFGCNLTGPTDETNCEVARRERDYAAFSKSREAAKPLFDFKD